MSKKKMESSPRRASSDYLVSPHPIPSPELLSYGFVSIERDYSHIGRNFQLLS